VTVPEADIVKTYNFRKDTLGTAETRSFVQIVAPDAKAAAVIAQRLAKGDQPAIVASAYGKQPVMIDSKPKSALPDRKVADAVFALAAGQVSAPINGDLGVSVVKLTKINPATMPSLESQRPAIEAELKAQAAQAKAYEQTQTYQDAHDGGANLIDAATKAGALVLTTAPIAANGVDQSGQPVPGLTPDALKTAFELPAGGESELIEAGKGEYFAVRVEKVIPSALPPLAEIREPLAQQWMLETLLERMKVQGRRTGRAGQEGRVAGGRRRLGPDPGAARRPTSPARTPASSRAWAATCCWAPSAPSPARRSSPAARRAATWWPWSRRSIPARPSSWPRSPRPCARRPRRACSATSARPPRTPPRPS
jgi:hypothetical protein